MRFFFWLFGLTVVVFVLPGCKGELNPVWKAVCEATCPRVEECFELGFDECMSTCLGELGSEPCVANEPALETCVADIPELSCMELDRGELPGSCEEICLCQSDTECEDGNECTTAICNTADGRCAYTAVADGIACASEAGACREGACELPCSEDGIRTAVDLGGGPYSFACQGPTNVPTQAEIVVDKDVILDGGGNLTVDGQGSHRVFLLWYGTKPFAEFRNLTVTGGAAPDDDGGGINNFGTLTLSNCTLSGNTAKAGGGVYNHGTLKVIDSTVVANTAGYVGGGMGNLDTLRMTNSLVSDNAAEFGGGVHNGALATIVDSTIVRNTATAGTLGDPGGGGIRNASNMWLINSTVSENATDEFGQGAGIANVLTARLWMTNSTVSGNLGSGIDNNAARVTLISATVFGNSGELFQGIHQDQGFMTFRDTLIADPCTGRRTNEWTSEGGNVESPGDTCGFDRPTDQVNVGADDLKLGPLQENGGPTETHALGDGSVAIDVIPEAECLDADGDPLTTDQRGFPRDSMCDVGAFEVQP